MTTCSCIYPYKGDPLIVWTDSQGITWAQYRPCAVHGDCPVSVLASSPYLVERETSQTADASTPAV